MSAEVMRRATGSILPDTDVIGAPSQLILEIGAERGSQRIDLGQIVGDGSTYSFVIRGLDPAYPSSSRRRWIAGSSPAMTTEPTPAPSTPVAAPCRSRSSATSPRTAQTADTHAPR